MCGRGSALVLPAMPVRLERWRLDACSLEGRPALPAVWSALLSQENRRCALAQAASAPGCPAGCILDMPRTVQAFPASSENEYGHLRLHDFSDAVARLPPEEIHGMAGGERCRAPRSNKSAPRPLRGACRLATTASRPLPTPPLPPPFRQSFPLAAAGAQQADVAALEAEMRALAQQMQVGGALGGVRVLPAVREDCMPCVSPGLPGSSGAVSLAERLAAHWRCCSVLPSSPRLAGPFCTVIGSPAPLCVHRMTATFAAGAGSTRFRRCTAASTTPGPLASLLHRPLRPAYSARVLASQPTPPHCRMRPT